MTGANYHVDGGMTALLSDPGALPSGIHDLIVGRREVRAWVEEALKRRDAG